MATKKITDLTLRTDADATCNIPCDDAFQTWRITLAQIKTYIQTAIAPLTTLGDVLFAGAAGAPTRLAGNTTTTLQVLAQTGTGSVSAAPAWRDFKAPTQQAFASGSGTYTKPSGVMYIRVQMVGGGGGGSGCGTGSTSVGGSGGATTFGSSLLSAGGGAGGAFSVGGGAGGTASLGTGPTGLARAGNNGFPPTTVNGSTTNTVGGYGANSPWLGGGGNTALSASGAAGVNNTGGGGQGSGSGAGAVSLGSGGGSGAYLDALISGSYLASTFSYAVGAAGTAGPAATGGLAGSVGGSGYILVTEYYQ